MREFAGSNDTYKQQVQLEKERHLIEDARDAARVAAEEKRAAAQQAIEEKRLDAMIAVANSVKEAIVALLSRQVAAPPPPLHPFPHAQYNPYAASMWPPGQYSWAAPPRGASAAGGAVPGAAPVADQLPDRLPAGSVAFAAISHAAENANAEKPSNSSADH